VGVLGGDDIDDEGYSRRGGGLPLRMSDELMANAPDRGDLVTVRGRFDDPLAATCAVSAPEGFVGVMPDREFSSSTAASNSWWKKSRSSATGTWLRRGGSSRSTSSPTAFAGFHAPNRP
jgi:hypothetical protein